MGWRDRLAGVGAPTTAPPTYFWQALVCVFLFLPTAVAAVAYALQVSRKLQVGDQTGAWRASRLARAWCLSSLVLFGVLLVALLAGSRL